MVEVIVSLVLCCRQQLPQHKERKVHGMLPVAITQDA
jgi:hypothetical protein